MPVVISKHTSTPQIAIGHQVLWFITDHSLTALEDINDLLFFNLKLRVLSDLSSLPSIIWTPVFPRGLTWWMFVFIQGTQFLLRSLELFKTNLLPVKRFRCWDNISLNSSLYFIAISHILFAFKKQWKFQSFSWYTNFYNLNIFVPVFCILYTVVAVIMVYFITES